MTDRAALFDFARRALLPAATFVVLAYFVFHAVAGNAGLLAWRDYRAQHDQLKVQSQAVASQRQALQRQTALLDPRHVNPDLADELVRKNLGLVGRDEVVIVLPPPAN